MQVIEIIDIDSSAEIRNATIRQKPGANTIFNSKKFRPF